MLATEKARSVWEALELSGTFEDAIAAYRSPEQAWLDWMARMLLQSYGTEGDLLIEEQLINYFPPELIDLKPALIDRLLSLPGGAEALQVGIAAFYDNGATYAEPQQVEEFLAEYEQKISNYGQRAIEVIPT